MTRTNVGSRMGAQKDFSKIPPQGLSRSSFDRSFGIKTTLSDGFLYPIAVEEILPGDTINIHPRIYGRVNTMLFPIMDNIWGTLHAWFCPLRLLWTNFPKFMGEQINPGDSTSFVTPKITSPSDGFARSGLLDYMGVPPKATPGTTHSVVAFYTRAYNLTWNQWYRDENLQNSLTVDLGDGPDSEANYVLKRRNKKHDYFTSALPFAQKGTAVLLPLGTTAPVTGNITGHATNAPTWIPVGGTSPTAASLSGNNALPAQFNPAPLGASGFQNMKWSNPQLLFSGTADLATASAATVNQLRNAFAIQSLYEKDARGGTRYTEITRQHFHVISPDARLQRVEYIGGGRIDVNIAPVAQTAADPAEVNPIGTMTGIGVIAGSIPAITYSATEHGVMLLLFSIRADNNYQQGTNRMWNRETRFDYFWPDLQGLGEQAILGKEIYTNGQGTPANGLEDYSVFGYQERYAEYRYRDNLITSKLRSTDPVPLDAWHLAQEFGSRPLLNSTFIEDNPPMERVVAVPSEPSFLVDAYFNFNHVRSMPMYGIPSQLTRL